jgi:hypothetical protein
VQPFESIQEYLLCKNKRKMKTDLKEILYEEYIINKKSIDFLNLVGTGNLNLKK